MNTIHHTIATACLIALSGAAYADVDFIVERLIETEIQPLSVVGIEHDDGWGLIIGVDQQRVPNIISVPSVDNSTENDFHTYTLIKKPRVMRLHDIARNDDRPDLLVTSSRRGLFSWASNGDGTFDEWGGDHGWSDNITVGDAIDHEENGKDYVLLGVIKDENRITSQAGDGDDPPQGTEKNIDVETCPMDIATGDFGGNAFQDIIVTNAGDNSLTILINTGLDNNDNTIITQESRLDDVGDKPIAVRSGEFDGQSGVDAVVLSEGANGQPGVTLLPAVASVGATSALNLTPIAFVDADFDEDGDLDLAVLGSDGSGRSQVLILANDGAGQFNVITEYEVPGTATALDVVFLEGDSRPDLAVASQPEGVYVLRNVQPTALTRYSIKKGERVRGNKRKLRHCDGKTLRIRALFRQNRPRPYMVDLRTTHKTPANPGQLHLEVKAKLDESGGTAKVYLRNINANSWDRVLTHALGKTEKTKSVVDIDAADYVTGGGKIKVRVTYDTVTTSDGDPFLADVDLVEITVNE